MEEEVCLLIHETMYSFKVYFITYSDRVSSTSILSDYVAGRYLPG